MADQNWIRLSAWALAKRHIRRLKLMQVTIKVFGKLRHYMPAGNTTGIYQINFNQGETLQQLLDKLPLPGGRPFLVIHNDNKIDASQLSSTAIDETDDIIVLAPVKGG